MTTLVTGGSGVVGAAVIRHLLDRGGSVRALARSEAAAGSLERMGADPVAGDIADRGSLETVMRGVDLVYHVAGLNVMCPTDPAELERVNVGGSVNVVEAAVSAGVRRIVYTSSAAAIGEEAGTVGREDSPHRGWYLSHYERSKHLAEQAVFSAADGRVEVVSVNPSSVQGPGRATGTGKLILDLVTGRLPALVDTRFSIVDIDDCARGHLLAADRGEPGRRYLLNSFTLTAREAVELLEEVLGRQVRVRWAPGWAATAGATLVEGVARVRGRQPVVCREMVRTLRHGHAYDGSLAVSALGIDYTSPRALLQRLIAWFRTEGLL